ncbi:hypothetical protein HNQ80_003252 [Anaerosolibacter carboniphilus]|uniref:Spo0E like sporulation regulatory protein n=1 Tax=Anaerosolibacter carboniphilus TaxID=1417629 RepID=A0A841KU67_9FIRM|nr:aspartyl-phosphate phosphatase Spo0E family protein [Anaerosolibacter carboniphilus]MBB6217146.1 hypothetical protein [Anaerosolibacter carboniphilus]
MNRLEIIRIFIESRKKDLDKLIMAEDNLLSSEVLNLSQEVDLLISEYYRCMKKAASDETP